MGKIYIQVGQMQAGKIMAGSRLFYKRPTDTPPFQSDGSRLRKHSCLKKDGEQPNGL
ncbi:hypothetical protein KQ939_13655 [Planococcus sp. CP5-4]|uniref:hypothetical protein n=1 Tax=unclassified Planococcus (in: firmicutes) TaxID=2662419 RepID=UPI001C2276BA|nr:MULTISPECIES: hypothetical protein [unclassified Planococcus (in: firmicutes)]MBU9674430.1 hypothetical protein [Planococcus sp. CP5-4_YE]MBV0909720.1 hypothetical protein [Planococcus sp. CP5-4_UN]MBW6064731.1 hypothetical protein [Planococcus sp. CP5-4]